MAIVPKLNFHDNFAINADGKHVVFYAGVAEFAFHGPQSGWAGEELVFRLPDNYDSVEKVTIMAGLGSIFNAQNANNAGWAVNDWRWVPVGASPGSSLFNVELHIDVAVSDSDGFLLRVNFHATVFGKLH